MIEALRRKNSRLNKAEQKIQQNKYENNWVNFYIQRMIFILSTSFFTTEYINEDMEPFYSFTDFFLCEFDLFLCLCVMFILLIGANYILALDAHLPFNAKKELKNYLLVYIKIIMIPIMLSIILTYFIGSGIIPDFVVNIFEYNMNSLSKNWDPFCAFVAEITIAEVILFFFYISTIIYSLLFIYFCIILSIQFHSLKHIDKYINFYGPLFSFLGFYCLFVSLIEIHFNCNLSVNICPFLCSIWDIILNMNA